MVLFRLEFLALAGLIASTVDGFAPAPTTPLIHGNHHTSGSALFVGPEHLESVQSLVTTATTTSNSLDSSDLMISLLTGEKLGELAKSIVIVLLFGGGLIPAAIAANKALVGTLQGKRSGGDDANADYISDSGATGPTLPGAALLFASEDIPLVDIIAILGRIQSVDSIADWKNLPSTKIEGASKTNPVMWCTRAIYKDNMRKAKFVGWPVDVKTGEPVGGAELEKAEKGRISKKGALIGDAALDAVFDTWAWGASVATPDKVENTLALFQKGNKSLDLGEFSGAAARGRAVTGAGALTFIVIQVLAYGSLFIAPALRVLLDVDIGFGQLGSCSETCTSLFDVTYR